MSDGEDGILTIDEQRLLRAFRTLPEHGQQAALELLETLAAEVPGAEKLVLDDLSDEEALKALVAARRREGGAQA